MILKNVSIIIVLLLLGYLIYDFSSSSSPSQSTSLSSVPDKNCAVSKWGNWTCNQQTGKASRTRTVLNPTSGSGDSCPHLIETADCKDCQVGDWSNWTCNIQTGKAKRTREIIVQPVDDGKICPITERDSQLQRLSRKRLERMDVQPENRNFSQRKNNRKSTN